MCKHKNIIIKSINSYIIPKGWRWLQEQECIDMAEYFIEEQYDEVICEDCGEQID